MHIDYVPNSQLHPMIHIDDHASSRTAANWWLTLISSCAALAAVHEEGTTAAHLIGLLRIEVEGARTGHGGVVHGVLAVGKLVLGRRQGPGVNNALFFRVHVARALSRVTMGINMPIIRATDEVPGVLIVGVGHLGTCI